MQVGGQGTCGSGASGEPPQAGGPQARRGVGVAFCGSGPRQRKQPPSREGSPPPARPRPPLAM